MNSKILREILGTVKSIYVAPLAGAEMLKVDQVKALKNLGLQGDRYSEKQGFWQLLPKPHATVRDVSFINEDDIADTDFLEHGAQ